MNDLSLLGFPHEQQPGSTAAPANARFTNFLSTAASSRPWVELPLSNWVRAEEEAGGVATASFFSTRPAAAAEHYVSNRSSTSNLAIRQLFRLHDDADGGSARPRQQLGFLDLEPHAGRQTPPSTTSEFRSSSSDTHALVAAGLRPAQSSTIANESVLLYAAAGSDHHTHRNSWSSPDNNDLRRSLFPNLHAANLFQLPAVSSCSNGDGASTTCLQQPLLQSAEVPKSNDVDILQIRSGATRYAGLQQDYAYNASGVDYFDYNGAGLARIGLNLGGRTYFAAEDNKLHYDSYDNYFPGGGSGALLIPAAAAPGATGRSSMMMMGSNAVNYMQHVPACQAAGCKSDLSVAKHYHRRHKVCEYHSKASVVTIQGNRQRFCQQCSRFHSLSEFDEGKRSCRKRLADHNRRRRKLTAGPSKLQEQGSAGTAAPTDATTTTTNNSQASSSPTSSSSAVKRNDSGSGGGAAADDDISPIDHNPAVQRVSAACPQVVNMLSTTSASSDSASMMTMPQSLPAAATTPSVLLTLQQNNGGGGGCGTASHIVVQSTAASATIISSSSSTASTEINHFPTPTNKPPTPLASNNNSNDPTTSSIHHLAGSCSLSLSNVSPTGGAAHAFASHAGVNTSSSSSSSFSSALNSFADEEGAELSRAAALPWLTRASSNSTSIHSGRTSSNPGSSSGDDRLSLGGANGVEHAAAVSRKQARFMEEISIVSSSSSTSSSSSIVSNRSSAGLLSSDNSTYVHHSHINGSSSGCSSSNGNIYGHGAGNINYLYGHASGSGGGRTLLTDGNMNHHRHHNWARN